MTKASRLPQEVNCSDRKLLTKDEARRIATNIPRLPKLLRKPSGVVLTGSPCQTFPRPRLEEGPEPSACIGCGKESCLHLVSRATAASRRPGQARNTQLATRSADTATAHVYDSRVGPESLPFSPRFDYPRLCSPQSCIRLGR